MKKWITLICTFTCILSLSGCGGEKARTANEVMKMEQAKARAVEELLPVLEDVMFADANPYSEYNGAEVEILFPNGDDAFTGRSIVDGNGMKGAVESFRSAAQTVGEIVGIENTTAEIDKDTIIVRVDVKGSRKNAQAEFVMTNDMFLVMESAALNPNEDTADKLIKAALNTVVGMGTVFIVLILIRYIIAAFIYIPPFVEKATAVLNAFFGIFKKKKQAEIEKTECIDNAFQQIVEKEENSNLASDLELVAVITAAIAAYEADNVPADGFVVRSIRKVNRRA